MSPILGILSSAYRVSAPLGSTYTLRTSMPSTAAWYDAAWNGTRWASVAQLSGGLSTNKAAYSSNGTSWTATTLPVNANWQNVIYDGTYFVATSGDSRSAYSSDGITWSSASGGGTGNHIDLATNGSGTSVAVAYFTGGNNLKYTNNASSWTAVTLGSSLRLLGVAYGASIWVVTPGAASTNCYTSTNGSSWTLQTGVMPANTSYTVCFGGSKFFAIAGTNGAYSSNGTSWTATTTPSGTWQNPTWSNGVYLVTSYLTANAITSTDAITWTSRTLPASYGVINPAGGNNIFMIMPGDTATTDYYTSP
jgi:roadblock/LC7 domain-containing protein